MRIALIADLHGNWPATQALERDLKRRNVEHVYCLGDLVGKGPSSDRTFDWVMANCDLVLGGNWDYGLGHKQFGADSFYWNQLGPDRLAKLAALPLEKTIALSGRKLRLFHGRPLMEALVTPFSPVEEIMPYFTNAEGERCDAVVFADIHRQMLRTLTPGLLVNCGSVGNGLGNPLCCYAVLEGSADDAAAPLDVLLTSLPYDREQAARDAEAAVGLNRAESFIREVRTGLYSRKQTMPCDLPGPCPKA